MSGFSFVCPHARPDENGAHDIRDAFVQDGVEQVLYCCRCGQAATVAEVLEQSRRDQDGPERKP